MYGMKKKLFELFGDVYFRCTGGGRKKIPDFFEDFLRRRIQYESFLHSPSGEKKISIFDPLRDKTDLSFTYVQNIS